MTAKLRLPQGLQTATLIVAVLAFGVLTVGVSLTAISAPPEHTAAGATVASPG